MEALTQLLTNVFLKMGVIHLTIGHIIMWLVAFFFLYLAVKKEYEPLLLLPIGFGIFLVANQLGSSCVWVIRGNGLRLPKQSRKAALVQTSLLLMARKVELVQHR